MPSIIPSVYSTNSYHNTQPIQPAKDKNFFNYLFKKEVDAGHASYALGKTGHSVSLKTVAGTIAIVAIAALALIPILSHFSPSARPISHSLIDQNEKKIRQLLTTEVYRRCSPLKEGSSRVRSGLKNTIGDKNGCDGKEKSVIDLDITGLSMPLKETKGIRKNNGGF